MHDKNKNLLKLNWERTSSNLNLSDETLAELVKAVTPSKITTIYLMSAGCANGNFKICFHDRAPIVLRIYVRDTQSLQIEQELLAFIHNRVPVANMLYADISKKHIPYPYAIFEFIEGQLLREVVMQGDENAIASCAFSAGKNLASLRKIKFNQSGFFQKNLLIRPFAENEDFLPYIYTLLNDPSVKTKLGMKLAQAINKIILQNMQYIPSNADANLTHADFDPSNILVKRNANDWQVTAILDWEFALSSTYLLDVGLFLRYSSQLPSCYEENFIQALIDYSGPLPTHWKRSAKLMDLLCLVQLLYYNSKDEKPNMQADILKLLERMVNEWDSY